MDSAIEVRDIGMKYEIGIARDKTVLNRLRYWLRGKYPEKDFWVLKNISFNVKKGEVFGIIGPNGAGKTTLLRIISGIQCPTEGMVKVVGRVNPFLQIGSALFPELTVLENIRLSAMLWGYSRDQLKERIPLIIKFAELEEYQYAELKALSTGYASRVAFSVAIHADLDVMLVDDLNAAGDPRFRVKSRKAFEGLLTSGKTVVYASATPSIIEKFCTTCVYIDKGKFVMLGRTEDVVKKYLEDCKNGDNTGYGQ